MKHKKKQRIRKREYKAKPVDMWISKYQLTCGQVKKKNSIGTT
jgi:hypothetical protein